MAATTEQVTIMRCVIFPIDQPPLAPKCSGAVTNADNPSPAPGRASLHGPVSCSFIMSIKLQTAVLQCCSAPGVRLVAACAASEGNQRQIRMQSPGD